MNLGALTPGQRAHVDQTLSLINEVERAWPYNQQLLNDDEAEQVVLERTGEPWQGMRADRAYLLWPDGGLVELDHALTDHDITRQVIATAPAHPQQGCDCCPVTGNVAGVAVVAVPRNLVALVLCPSCVARLSPDVLIPINTGGTNG